MSKASWQRNESTHYWQHTTKEHRLDTVFIKPVLGNIHMALLEEFSKHALAGELEGSVLFMPVPDEESLTHMA